MLLDCYCTLIYKNVSLAFFVSFGFAFKQQHIVNFYMLMENLHLYFPLCCRPVLLFLCHFACSLSFLLFHLRSLLVYKEPISLLKKGIFLGQKGFG